MASNDTAPSHPVASVRSRMGITQAELGALCGVSAQSVYLAESGRITTPRKIGAALERLGIANADKLAAECSAWVAARTARLAAELQASTASVSTSR